MQSENQRHKDSHDCLVQCLECYEMQDYKINLAKFHGVCSSHKNSLGANSWILCKTCETNIYIYDFQIILCDYCLEKPKILALECSHNLCENCIQENSENKLICPICPTKHSENDKYINEIINYSPDQQNYFSEERKSDKIVPIIPDEIIQKNEIIQNPQEIPIEILQKIAPVAVSAFKSKPQCQKCFIGVLERSSEKEFKCQNCDKKFCGKCFKCLTGKIFHYCKDSFLGNGHYVNEDLWKKNEFLRTHEIMIQICPCCNVLCTYQFSDGFIVKCKYPLCKIKPKFCLHCGKLMNLGEENVHFDEGENNPCRNVQLCKDNLKKRKYVKIRLQSFDY